MSDVLLIRLTAALMDAMGCEHQDYWQRQYGVEGATLVSRCDLHYCDEDGVRIPDRWPCPVATRHAEALAPFVRDEIADALEQITRRWQLKDWADAPRDSDPVRERLANAQYVTGWLRTRAEDVRRG